MQLSSLLTLLVAITPLVSSNCLTTGQTFNNDLDKAVKEACKKIDGHYAKTQEKTYTFKAAGGKCYDFAIKNTDEKKEAKVKGKTCDKYLKDEAKECKFGGSVVHDGLSYSVTPKTC